MHVVLVVGRVVAGVVVVAVAYIRLTAAPFDVTSTSPNTLRKEHNQKKWLESIKQQQKKKWKHKSFVFV